MTEPVIIALIASLPPTIVALLSWWSSRKNGKNIQEIHLAINSRLTELLAATKGEATELGRREGIKEQKDQRP